MATAISRIRTSQPGDRPIRLLGDCVGGGYIDVRGLYEFLTKAVGTCAADRQEMRGCLPECSCQRCRIERGLAEAERACAELEADDREQRWLVRQAAEEARDNRPEPIHCGDCRGTGIGWPADHSCRVCGGSGLAAAEDECGGVDLEAEEEAAFAADVA